MLISNLFSSTLFVKYPLGREKKIFSLDNDIAEFRGWENRKSFEQKYRSKVVGCKSEGAGVTHARLINILFCQHPTFLIYSSERLAPLSCFLTRNTRYKSEQLLTRLAKLTESQHFNCTLILFYWSLIKCSRVHTKSRDTCRPIEN